MERYIRNRSKYNIDPGRQRTYYEVGKLQINLTEKEEINLLYEYKQLRTNLQKYILSKRKCRDWFFNKYNETMAAGKSVAKLSSAFNTKTQGVNKIIHDDMIKQIKRIAELNLSEQKVLYDLRLSDFCYSEMVGMITPPTKKLISYQTHIAEIEETLIRSMMMAAHEIAIRNASPMLNIDVMDAAQEVTLYFLESIRKYDLDYRTIQGNRVKLCTYAYGRADHLIKEWILTTSRLIRIPRSKMERMLIIVKAYDRLVADKINIEDLTEEANKIIEFRKGELTDHNSFTVEEVDSLVQVLVSNCLNIDQSYNKNDRTPKITLADMLGSNEIPADKITEVRHSKEQLINIMKKHLTQIEYQVIMLRYFHESNDNIPKALSEISGVLSSMCNGKVYSRESIRQIEKNAISKLKEIREVKRLW